MIKNFINKEKNDKICQNILRIIFNYRETLKDKLIMLLRKKAKSLKLINNFMNSMKRNKLKTLNYDKISNKNAVP